MKLPFPSRFTRRSDRFLQTLAAAAGTWVALVAVAFAPRALALQPFVKIVTPGNPDIPTEEVGFQVAETDPTGGGVFVAGVYRGQVNFSAAVSLRGTDNSLYEVFLAKQNAEGDWDWVVRGYEMPSAAILAVIGNTRGKPTAEQEVRDIEVTADAVYLAGTFRGDSSSRVGWVSKLDRSGVHQWTRFFTAGDAAVNAVGVNPKDGSVYVGGSFNTFTFLPTHPYTVQDVKEVLHVYRSSGQINSLANVGSIGAPEESDYDAFVMKFNASGAYQWNVRAGSPEVNLFAWDYTSFFAGGTRKMMAPEETAALEVDGAGTVHVLLNVGGKDDPNQPGTDGAVRLLRTNGSEFTHFTTGCYQVNGTQICSLGAPTAVAARIAADGTWETFNDLVAGDDLAGSAREISGLSSAASRFRGRDLTLVDGKVVVVGSYQYGNLPAGPSPIPWEATQGFMLRANSETYTADGPAVYFKSLNTAAGSDTAPRRVRGAGSRIFVTGNMRRTLQVFSEPDHKQSTLGPMDKELTGLLPTDFIASFDTQFNPQMLRTTTLSNEELRPETFSGTLLAYDPVLDRAYWGGQMGGENQLVLGDIPNIARFGPASAPGWGWITAFDGSGRYELMTRLTVHSDFGPVTVGSQPIAATDFSLTFFQGKELTLTVPVQVPASLIGQNTRRLSRGFQVNGSVVSGDANRYTLVLNQDTSVRFDWETQHRLTIESDHASAGLDDTAAAGSASPPIGDTWVKQGDLVTAFVNGVVYPVDQSATGTRWAVTGYDASGSVLDSVDANATVVAGLNSFDQVIDQHQVPQFTMSGPGTIQYHWKKQHRVQVSSTSDDAKAFLLSRQTTGTGNSYSGDGEFWFDAGSTVQLGAQQSGGSLSLRGWRNADPVPDAFPDPAFLATEGTITQMEAELDDYLTKVTVSAQPYLFRTIAGFNAPVRVTWDFGDLITRLDVAIGSPVTTPGGLGILAGRKPIAIRVVDSPPGSSSADMQVWDDVADVVYPLRPGIVFLDWETAAGKAVTQIVSGFPGEPIPQKTPAANFPGTAHYRHIANTLPEVTPPVDLDPDPTDAVHFLGLKYQTGPAQVSGKNFTATAPGKAVLLFSRSSNPALPAAGNLNFETLRVRVVETKDWQTVLGLESDAQPVGYLGAATSPLTHVESPVSGFATRLAVADFNDDGKPDILQGQSGATPSGNRLFLNSGDSDPLTDATFRVVGTGGNDVDAADVNGDGRPDFIEGPASGQLKLFLNNGTSDPFAGVTPLLFGPGSPISRVRFADVDGDGRLDLIAARQNTAEVEVYYNTGDDEPFPAAPSAVVAIPGFSSGALILVVGDINGDGRADMVVGRLLSKLVVYLSAGGATPYTTPASVINDVASPRAVSAALADFNRDGRPDLVWLEQSANLAFDSFIYVHLNNGTATPFGAATSRSLIPFLPSGVPLRLAAGDANGDGYADILFSSAAPSGTSTTIRALYSAAGSFASNPAPPPVLTQFDGRSVPDLLVQDLNGDGEPDLLTSGAGFLGVKINAGNRNRYRDGVVGTRVSSGYDTAGLHTGYLIHPYALYNADIHQRNVPSGPVIPVNRRVSNGMADPLVVVWYERTDSILWPYQPVQYDRFAWPATPVGKNPPEGSLKRIVIASRLGSEGLDAAGNAQIVFDPARYSGVKIYNQPIPGLPGYNPNEEHARVYPSLLSAVTGVKSDAAFALRNDLNISEALIAARPDLFTTADYTSDPYVLVQYFDAQEGEAKMAVYAVQREDAATHDARLADVPGSTGDTYVFNYNMKAGELIQAPYPLNLVQGLEPCVNTVPDLFSTATALPNGSFFTDGVPSQRTWMVDHKGGAWAVSGGSFLYGSYFYRVAPDFWYPFTRDSRVKQVGQCVPFLPPFNIGASQYGAYDALASRQLTPKTVQFNTAWPDNPAILKLGETLTFAGGENKADNPESPGLPGIIGWAAGQVVYDSKNPAMKTRGTPSHFDSFMARVISPLEERKVALDRTGLPANLNPASSDVIVDGDTWRFSKLSPSLQKRVFYRPLSKLTAGSAVGVLGIKGFVNDKTLGDPTLTSAPPPVYALEPNVLTPAEKLELEAVGGSNNNWLGAVEALYNLCRNPAGLDRDNDGSADTDAWNVGLEPELIYDPSGRSAAPDDTRAAPLSGLGAGLALVTNPNLLDPAYRPADGWVTLAENNHPSLGDAPVAIHVIKVDASKLYRGAIKTIAPVNVFDENITLLHNADFGGNVANVSYAWWYHEADGTVKTGQVPPGNAPEPVWNAFANATGVLGQNRINLNGNPVLLLADNLFFVRYRYGSGPIGPSTVWSDWAGAANSSILDLDGDQRPDFRAQLATGWVKRVLDGINPFEARVRDFERNDSPATASSMIQLLGGPYVGPVALNASKDVVENVGLIELYETVLKRARDLSIDASQPAATSGINAAILLASTRLADFYTLLGHEAWDDALDPTIGYGNDALGSDSVEHGSLSSTRFCFENQLPTLLDEELALLRGVDESFGRPVFNRLMWNFTKGEGEVAYALNYQISDVNHDGFRDENDALTLYPQGHGDAWGHYLNAMRKRYDLLRHGLFRWEARSESYNLLDVVFGVDFFDERKFAETAAARAQVGAEIVNLTFRARYTENPDGQWQGYTDNDTGRAWGVTEWARRAGQAALFDWVVANALVPYEDTDATHTGLKRIDRKSLGPIAEISANFAGIQVTLDSSNNGLNPLGLDPDVVPFDIDPTHIDVGSTAQIGRAAVQGLSHFEQIFERAYEAMRNADAALRHANDQKVRLRNINTSAEQLREEAIARDLEFRNRLIEIFGTPYEGTIGAGKAYPPGYNGADLNLFMYVDVNAVNADTVPKPAESYQALFAGFHELFMDVPAAIGASVPELISQYYRKFDSGDGNGPVEDNNLQLNSNVEVLGDGFVLHLDLPATAADYTFVAPAEWGQRAAPGRLQTQISEIVQTESDLSLAVGDYDFLHKQMRDQVEYLKVKIQASGQVIGNEQDLATLIESLDGEIHNLLHSSALFEMGGELAATTSEAIAEAFGESAFDFTFGGRSISLLIGGITKAALSSLAIEDEGEADLKEREKEHARMLADIEAAKLELAPEIVGIFNDIEELLVNEGVTRIRVFGIREQLRNQLDQYRATLQEGLRLLEERRNANATIASSAQENRYHDLLFRSARHESIQRYRSLYDLAQRYCYMAAKAYDYETNFDPNDRGSVQPLLADICKERTLGEFADGAPLNRGGLAGIMARIHGNFRAVEGRLGFNNLQIDTTSFSIRKEMARSATDSAWSTTLRGSQVTDLWLLPEFRRYCRPFIARSSTPQPGIVLRFATQVKAGRNFFGQPLGPGDSTFDPTMFATKIRASGVHFDNYPLTKLARTPYVYLIPTGFDTMIVPDSPTLATRTWNVVDQAIPVPNLTGAADLGRPNWLTLVDSLSGPLGATRRFSSFRAGVELDDPPLVATRLIGRSVWNTGWMLIIPGQTLHANPATGLEEFNSNVSDIRLTFETYGYSGN